MGYGTLLSLPGTPTQYPIRLLFRWNRFRNKDFIEINNVRTRLTAPVHDCSSYATISPQDSVYTLTSSNDAVTLEVTEDSRMTILLRGFIHNPVGLLNGLFLIERCECRGMSEVHLVSTKPDSPKTYISGSPD